MRVFIDSFWTNRKPDKASGPSIFMDRLCHQLSRCGVEIVSDKTGKTPDISLGNINMPSVPGKRNIVRIDGCYYNKASGVKLNKSIRRSIENAHGVIYQSRFSQHMCEKLLKLRAKKSIFIHNGVDQQWVSKIPPTNDFADYKYVFVACASWRPSKRPKSIVSGFLRANIPGSLLLMAGKYDDMYNDDPRVKFVGHKSQQEIISLSKKATAMVHICRIESCPNAVVEALSCGLPVLHNNDGGTPEIVGNDGVKIECDTPFDDYISVNSDDLDNVDPDLIASGMHNIIGKQWDIKRPDLDIKHAAQSYLKFFKDTLRTNRS